MRSSSSLASKRYLVLVLVIFLVGLACIYRSSAPACAPKIECPKEIFSSKLESNTLPSSSSSSLSTSSNSLERDFLQLPTEIRSHSHENGGFVFNVSWDDRRRGVHVKTDIPCDLLDDSLLKNDRWCYLTARDNHIESVLNSRFRNFDRWDNCTIVGASSVLQNRTYRVSNTALFSINYHNFSNILEIGNNVRQYRVVHYGHFLNLGIPREILREAEKVYYVPSFAKHMNPKNKDVDFLDCNAYLAVTRLKKTLFEDGISWQSYTGTVTAFSLLNKCKSISLLGFFEPDFAVGISYGFDVKSGKSVV